MMIQEERARQEERNSRQIYGPNTKCLVLKADVTDFVTGITRVVETQEEIITAAAKSNLHGKLKLQGRSFASLL